MKIRWCAVYRCLMECLHNGQSVLLTLSYHSWKDLDFWVRFRNQIPGQFVKVSDVVDAEIRKSNVKVMLIVFFDARGIVLRDGKRTERRRRDKNAIMWRRSLPPLLQYSSFSVIENRSYVCSLQEKLEKITIRSIYRHIYQDQDWLVWWVVVIK